MTGLISNGLLSNDCDNDMLLSLCTLDTEAEETDLSPGSIPAQLLLLELDDTEDTDEDEDEDLGTGLRVTAEVGGGGGIRDPEPAPEPPED